MITNINEFKKINDEYISTSQLLRNKAKEVKQKYKNIKFSITVDYNSIKLAILKAPIELRLNPSKSYETINHFYIEKNYKDMPEAKELLLDIYKIISGEQKEITYDGDYGSVPNYYINMTVGKWDKPFIVDEKLKKSSNITEGKFMGMKRTKNWLESMFKHAKIDYKITGKNVILSDDIHNVTLTIYGSEIVDESIQTGGKYENINDENDDIHLTHRNLSNMDEEDNEEQLYHEIDWNDLKNSIDEYASVFPKEEHYNIYQTFNFLQKKIEEYKMTN